MFRLLLSSSPLALLAATGVYISTLDPVNAADCVIDADSTATNGNCADPGNGDTLTLGGGVVLTLDDISGLSADSDGAIIIVDGDINVTAKTDNSPFDDPPTGSFGVRYAGDNGFIQNNGNITITNDGGPNDGVNDDGPNHNWGILYRGNGGRIENHGTITTDGRRGFGINLGGGEDRGGQIQNFGDITTYGYYARAIMISKTLDGDDDISFHAINHSGATITTHGEVAHGIWFNQNDLFDRSGGRMVNFGLIETHGVESTGMNNNHMNSVTVNYGTIITHGDGFQSMFLGGSGSIFNYGSLTSHAAEADTMAVVVEDPLGLAEKTVVANYGTITSAADSSFFAGLGVNVENIAEGVRTEVINHGSVFAENGLGISVQGAGEVMVENSGFVKAGEDSYSIELSLYDSGISLDGDTFDLFLRRGSVLVGDVRIAFPEITTVHFDLGLNAAVYVDPDGVELGYKGEDGLEGVVTLNSANGVHTIRDSVLYSADTTDYVAQDAAMGGLTRAVQSLVSERLLGTSPPPPQAEGSNSPSSLLSFCEGQWAAPFGGALKSDGGDTFAAYRSWSAGMATGCRLEGGMNAYSGVSYASVEPEDGDNFSIQSFGGFAGLQGELPETEANYSMTLGYMHHFHERQVADNRIRPDGIDEGEANYSSVFVTPSMSLMLPSIGAGAIDLQLSYTGVWYAAHDFDYDESDTDLSIDSSFSHGANVQLAYSHALDNGVTLRVGGGGSWQQRADTGLTLAGTSFDIEDPRDGLQGHAFAGFATDAGAWARIGASFGEDSQMSLSATAGVTF